MCPEQPAAILTFDSLPVHDTLLMDCESRTQKCMDALSKAGVRTVFFATGKEMERFNPRQMKCIHRIDQQGHFIANHSHSYLGLSTTPVKQYIADVMKCEAWILPFSNYKKWFRYPFFDCGLDSMQESCAAKARECGSALKKLGFRHAYASIDSFDWFVNLLLQEKLQDCVGGRSQIKMDNLESFYIDHLRRTIGCHFDRKVKAEKPVLSTHVLVFHANDLTSLFLLQIIAMLRASGWHIGCPDEIFDNPCNRLAEFEAFIELEVNSASKSLLRLHDPDKIIQEFDRKIVH